MISYLAIAPHQMLRYGACQTVITSCASGESSHASDGHDGLRKGNTGVSVIEVDLITITRSIHEIRKTENCDRDTGGEGVEYRISRALPGEKRTATSAEQLSRCR